MMQDEGVIRNKNNDGKVGNEKGKENVTMES